MTSAALHKHAGGCHCGNIRIVVEVPTAPEATALRSCGCAFCRAHGVRTIADPSGVLKVWAQDWTDVTRYHFETGTADFLICRRCGVYVGAVCQTPSGLRAVANVNSLHDRARFVAEPKVMDHAGETPQNRIARRAETWLAAVVHD
jgi:hypothetical protein